MGDSRLSIVVVTWNSARYLPRCLAGITGQSWPDIEVVVIDNASTDGSVEIVRNTLPSAHLIANSENRGFSAAVNQGIRAATGAYVLLCNPDAFLQPDYAQRCIEALRGAGDSFGMAGGTLHPRAGGGNCPPPVLAPKGSRIARSGPRIAIRPAKRG